MSKSYYLPNADKDRAAWLKNFSSKFGNYSALLGFLPEDVASVANDSVAFGYALDVIETFKTETQERTSYKDILRDGPIGAPLGSAPTFPPLPPPPPTVAAGIFPRTSAIVKRMKAHPNYTEAIGRDCGIVGAESANREAEMKPDLELSQEGGNIIVKYTKGSAEGIKLLSKRANETEFTFLAVVTKTTYKDIRSNLVANQPEVRHYCAWFLMEDEAIGQCSDEVQIVV